MSAIRKFKKDDEIIGKGKTYPDGVLVIARLNPEGHPKGSISCFPKGGGMGMVFRPKGILSNGFRLVTSEERKDIKWKKVLVSMDCMPDGKNEWLPSWDCGDRWNGWSCPNFEFKTAMIFAKITQADEGMMLTTYDKKKDTFITKDRENGEVMDEAQGTDIVVKGKRIHVYDIGSHSWCWIQKEVGEE